MSPATEAVMHEFDRAVLKLVLVMAVICGVIVFATWRISFWYGHLAATKELALKCIEKRGHK